ncbi:MAG: beta-xylosidase [Anaerolinea sp.]|nr:beta-xylosidase [Anaerolinea sp.]
MTVEFSIDPKSKGRPFAHYWEQCVGSCHAIMGTRQDWREQLEKSHRELGFQFVRFHGLLNDEMSVVNKDRDGNLSYSFFNIDSVFDFLLSIGMKPFIELGFMPEALASGATTCFHYKGNITPPADYDQWADLIKTLTQHLVDRYGLAEVQSWFFEVWNEPNLKFFFDGTQKEYFKLYRTTCLAIKSVDSQLRVGGPATSINAWIPDTIAFCKKTDTPLDFLSTHHYPTDDPLWKNSDISMEEFFAKHADEFGSYERGILYKMTAKTRQEAGDLPLYYTEWNTSAVLPDDIHDEAYSAALVAKTIADNDGLVQNYSFWTFSDLFEEAGQFSAPFHGGFGLQNIYGIPKPTYRLFEMLHGLGNERLSVTGGKGSTVEILAVKKDTDLTLLVYNHDIPGSNIHSEEVIIKLAEVTANATASITRIDAEHVNPKQKWINLGSPVYPDKQQLELIEKATQLITKPIMLKFEDGIGLLKFSIPEHGIVEIKIKR